VKSSAWITSFILAAAFGAPALAQPISDADAGAMKKLAWHNLAEIEAGKLAAAKAQSADVKQFAQRMADDHQKMLQDLQRLAQKKDVKLPTQIGMEEQAELLKLRAVSGEQFDRRYMAQMVKDHEKDARETQDIASKAQDSEFEAAVQQANARIKEHLQMAQRIAGAQGASGATRSSK
jgi:putative membrane protein